jgi:tRNA pseudouridine32 synthase/23S rRNA pseudouridine746 synthase/23S rRNA pseudouridine1911/1915/1917 synthase
LLYRDGLVLVIDKPAGIAVHPGPGSGPDLESGFGALCFGRPHPPALAHRLDRDTSGCLVLGRHPKALRRLGALLAEGRVEKVYWAIVEGRPPQNKGRIESGLKKLTRGSGWRMVVDPEGQRAITDYRLLGAAARRAWLELRPRTGRTHQIRVHCAELGCPVIGDPLYGRPESAEPLLLHARAIALPLYPAKLPIAVTAPVPPHMLAALQRLGYASAAQSSSESDEVNAGDVEVRRLLPAEAGLYRDIRLEALKREPEAFGSTFAAENAEPLAWFADRLGSSAVCSSAVYGAFAGSDLLGVAGFFVRQGLKEAHKGVLWGMYVRPWTRRAGVGRLLVEAVIDHARQCVELIQLSVVSGNERARHLYASLGFVEYGIEKNALKQDERYWDEVLMAKPLPTAQHPRS